MYKFGPTSKTKLSTCHPDLQEILNKAIKLMDFSVLEGHRDQERQDRFFFGGFSKLRWPNSKHNTFPSTAADIAPYPIKWSGKKALERFTHLQGIVKGIASEMGLQVRFGGDWDNDGELLDNNFDDLPHVELVNPRPLTKTEIRKLKA